MKNSTRLLLTILVACTACDKGQKPTPERMNLSVSGSPECLAEVYVRINKYARDGSAPVWAKSGGTGEIEFGALDQSRFEEVRDELRPLSCVRRIQKLPCSMLSSDVNFCRAPS